MEAHGRISDYVGSGFIYIFSFWKKLRWGDDCNMRKRCPLQVTCELGIDMWQRQREFYNICTSIFVQECYFCLALAASANFMHTLTISSSLPPDHACPPPPSCLSCHLLSTFVWFTVIRCEGLTPAAAVNTPRALYNRNSYCFHTSFAEFVKQWA